jgi:hypothetical protein
LLNQLVGPVLIWLAAVFSQSERLTAPETVRIMRRDVPKKRIAMSLIGFATVGLFWQVYQAYGARTELKKKTDEVKKLQQHVSVVNSKLFNEASAGTIINDLAYVVDDEKPNVFVFRLDEEYQLIDKIELKENGKVLTGDEVDDLEAIASAEGKLYLITSHSNTKRGKPNPARQRLLEVSLEGATRGQVTNSADNLRELIWKDLKGLAASYQNEDHKDEVMQIEGFAIDEGGTAYIGLRAPLTETNDYALVLSAKLSDLFFKGKEPQFKVFRLNLGQQNVNDNNKNVPHGIVSLDYDAQTGKMLIVGNSAKNSHYFSPILCQWDFAGEHKDDAIQNPKCNPIPPYEVFGSTPKTSKIELLLLPREAKSDRVFTFLDTDAKGNGGQLSYTRSEIGLAR